MHAATTFRSARNKWRRAILLLPLGLALSAAAASAGDRGRPPREAGAGGAAASADQDLAPFFEVSPDGRVLKDRQTRGTADSPLLGAISRTVTQRPDDRIVEARLMTPERAEFILAANPNVLRYLNDRPRARRQRGLLAAVGRIDRRMASWDGEQPRPWLQIQVREMYDAIEGVLHVAEGPRGKPATATLEDKEGPVYVLRPPGGKANADYEAFLEQAGDGAIVVVYGTLRPLSGRVRNNRPGAAGQDDGEWELQFWKAPAG